VLSIGRSHYFPFALVILTFRLESSDGCELSLSQSAILDFDISPVNAAY